VTLKNQNFVEMIGFSPRYAAPEVFLHAKTGIQNGLEVCLSFFLFLYLFKNCKLKN
jgi:hypothetical protein